jgi:hypothetical protein
VKEREEIVINYFIQLGTTVYLLTRKLSCLVPNLKCELRGRIFLTESIKWAKMRKKIMCQKAYKEQGQKRKRFLAMNK